MTSAIDLQALSSLLAGLDIDNNVFSESHLPVRRTPTTRPPLQPSLSLPLDSYHHHNELTPSPETSFLPLRLPAPKFARTQSIGESISPYLGVGVQETAKAPSTAAPARYKTELCRPFEENGTCRYGSKCQFAHGKAELRSVVRHPKYKTDLCRTFHTTGLCPYGPRCHFIHNDDERKSSDSTSDQMRQVTAVQELHGRRCGSVHEDKSRLQRHCSDLQDRHREVLMRGTARISSGSDLQRRASSVADAVIRNSIHYQQHPLQTVPETSDLHPGLKSLGSVTDSFSSASSVSDSPSPSPTSGLIPSSVDEAVLTARQPPSTETDKARAALLAELVSRLGPQDIAVLIRALQLPGNASPSTSSPAGSVSRPPGITGNEVDANDVWNRFQNRHQYQNNNYQQKQQQQFGNTPTNLCW